VLRRTHLRNLAADISASFTSPDLVQREPGFVVKMSVHKIWYSFLPFGCEDPKENAAPHTYQNSRSIQYLDDVKPACFAYPGGRFISAPWLYQG